MKAALAFLPLAACAAVHAQSSVTLYGAVDAAVTYTNNQHGAATYQASSGGRAGDKFGLTGTETLSPNLKARFVLESGFNIQNGTEQPANTLFGRQAYVGLSGTWGEVLLGRQYSLTNNYLSPLGSDTLFAGGLGSMLSDVDAVWNYDKVSNAIKFNSADVRGWRYSAMYSRSSSDLETHDGYSIGSSYTKGNLTIAAAYMNMSTPATTMYLASEPPVAGQPYALPVANPIFDNYTTANTQQVFGVGASYVSGRSQLTAVYTNVRFQDIVRTLSNANAPTNAVFNNYQLNYAFKFTPYTMAGVGYQYSVAPHSEYQLVDFGAAYYISKATYVYWITAWQHASGTNSAGKPAVADMLALAPSSDSDQLTVRVGLRHLF